MYMGIVRFPVIWYWLYQRIEFLYYHIILYSYYTYSTGTCAFCCHRFKIDGCKIKMFHTKDCILLFLTQLKTFINLTVICNLLFQQEVKYILLAKALCDYIS